MGVWRRGNGGTAIDRWSLYALWYMCAVEAYFDTLKHLDGDSYLVSTGNVRQYCSSVDNEGVEIDKALDDIDEVLQGKWLNTDEDQVTTEQFQDTKTALLELHIVYHTIYQTPVLYFRAYAVDGTPLPASTVMHDVQLPGSNDRSTFVAMEEHPVLGKPFSFLHPCETAGAMQLLQEQLQPTRDLSELQVPQYLASWLSFVQPLTGISPIDYYSV
ncbi:hypothetical protein V7S43_000055 [Phytophthora oleae]|uniref:Ubiquitin-like-conjugating enzyme ATG10 n=1 Tax=Phytophthora oleae TaxID=2107226 RepID=A0ABD3G7E1_9STRA